MRMLMKAEWCDVLRLADMVLFRSFLETPSLIISGHVLNCTILIVDERFR